MSARTSRSTFVRIWAVMVSSPRGCDSQNHCRRASHYSSAIESPWPAGFHFIRLQMSWAGGFGNVLPCAALSERLQGEAELSIGWQRDLNREFSLASEIRVILTAQGRMSSTSSSSPPAPTSTDGSHSNLSSTCSPSSSMTWTPWSMSSQTMQASLWWP
jgi:hypothetical protein